MSWRAQLEASLALIGEADSKLFLIEVADPTDLGALDPVLVQTGLPWRFVYNVSELLPASESRFIVTPIHHGHIEWLNHNRPLFNARKLVVLFVADRETASHFSHAAPDIYSWLAAKIELPSDRRSPERSVEAVLGFPLIAHSQLPSAKVSHQFAGVYLAVVSILLAQDAAAIAALAPLLNAELLEEEALPAGELVAHWKPELIDGMDALCQAIDPALGDAFRRGVEQARQSPSSAAPDPA